MDLQRMIRVNKAAEKFWLIVIFATIAATIYYIQRDGWDGQKQTIVLPFIAIAWYSFRRFFRKKMEREANAPKP
ncbi:MAG: hypothetical protein OSA37_08160 [Flavobacteriales bacterium]|nr:hypothetical protein [Flavobacteriales bacterium]